MKKFILGCVLIISGIIGGTGWLIAAVIIQGAGASPSVLETLKGTDLFVIVIFYIIAIIGAVFAIKNIKMNS